MSGYITTGKSITPDEFNDFQPHQVAKKISLKWRYLGLLRAGLPVIDAPLSRLDTLGERMPQPQRDRETRGTMRRFGNVE
jgi:coenzyme F420 hydrogenase subunit beta